MTPAKTLTADIKEAVNGSFEELYLRNCICKAYCRPIINFFADRLVMKSLPPQEGEFDLLLCPLHMNQSHWGLIATDLVGKKLLFDDGYKLQSDSSIKPSMKYLLDVDQLPTVLAVHFGPLQIILRGLACLCKTVIQQGKGLAVVV